jgi:outer membrane protein OmpA-like peptidoglycan-associated protein/tetratricopeptide (TPR) repeat protein
MKTIITTAVAIFMCSVLFGQMRKADRLFEKWQYNEAAELYAKQAAKKPSPDVYYKLGMCYQKMFRFQDAVNAYDKVNAYGTYSNPDFYLNYGLVLKTNSRYTDAKQEFMKYDSIAPADPRGRFYASSCDSVLSDLQKPIGVTVTNVSSINTSDAAFSASLYKDGIVYASNRPGATGTKTFPWNGKSYLDLFYAKRDTSATSFGKSSPFPTDEVNKEYHDGPASFTKNYDTIYFNRVSRDLKGPEKRTIGVEHSKIYYSTLKDGEWEEEKPFAFNNDSFGVFTPFVTNDGSRLYFASDMPGGMGQTDIYYCTKSGDSWSKPVNLGPSVNTFGREQFPSLDSAGNLYFASDGYKGYGGLDMCVSKFSGGSFQNAQVLKAPLNSPDNEYGIAFVKSGKSGYLSSARKDGQGDADIYYFDLDRDSIPCDINTTIYVMGYDCVKKEPLTEVHRDTTERTAEIRPSEMLLRPIYFDFDKSDIRSDAINAIDSVATVLKNHPDWTVVLSGHADSRGTNEYNLALSQRRANSALRYLSSKGIDRSRIQTKGYGETQLKNNCTDGVPCSEAEHQQNRRVEFTLTFRKNDLSAN